MAVRRTIQTFHMAAVSAVLFVVAAQPLRADTVGGSFSRVGDDTTVRFFHNASALHDGLVMVTGGMRLNFIPPSLVSLDSVSFYDPDTQQFAGVFEPDGGPSTLPTLLFARSSHTQATLADGRVLITGGNINATGTSPGTATGTVEIFDPQTGQFTAGPPMNEPRSFHTATILSDGHVLVSGGGTWQTFDPADDTWSPGTSFLRARSRHAAVLLSDVPALGDQRVLVIGGNGAGPDTLELIDPTGASQLSTTALSPGVCDLAAVTLADGSVLIVGGQNTVTGDTTNNTYRYFPLDDELMALAPPPSRPAGIADHEMVRFGRYACVFGGEQQVSAEDTELNYAAVFDSINNAWPFVTTMMHVHDDFASVKLGDDRVVLIDGGVPLFGQEAPSNRAELFTINQCLADVNCSGVVNIDDLLTVISAFGPCPADEPCLADINLSGAVNIDDLLLVISGFGPCD